MADIAPQQKAVFLDRDGTINIDPGYINNPDDLVLYPGVVAALRRLKNAGYLLILVSNQSGVNRGKITPFQMKAVEERLQDLLNGEGVGLDAYQYCHHRPDENCECRKPKAKLIFDAAERFGIDLRRSFMIGDKLIDVECGLNAGVRRAILVRTGNGQLEESKLRKISAQGKVGIAQDLEQAAELILGDTRI